MPIFNKPLSTNVKSWSDLDLNFQAHPITKDIVRKKNIEAIKRSVKNLVLTNKYERPFHPEIGSSILAMLFEPVSPTTGAVLKSRIREVLTNYEPRAIITDIQVSGDIDKNGYYVSILFTPINTLEPVTIELFLERLR
jgi:phage baseplate assembly protein W